MKFNWNPDLYDNKHDFVFKFGEEIVQLLNPQKNETILDIGCGTGDLTKKIAELCGKVTGIDNSSEMIQTALKKYPEISFIHADAKDYQFDNKFDAIFSNAVLHWIPQADIAVQNANRHLKVGGRYVVEFGGKRCNYSIVSTLQEQLDKFCIDYPSIESMLFFPSISQYSTLLENNGFEVNFAILFDRPTELQGGLEGLSNFIEMFLKWLFINASDSEKSAIIKNTIKILKPRIFNGTSWIADYRRIRIVAYKKNEIN
ncbi:MAG: class I SAM-dependent methyltransferase [Prolixibacteraceae bacterium]|jgi:ubiquinone/menaquinone biosynthesis C-methylase UbiE|nr:class I SAM-dependent methyltransferase [Prolixibacteraceae bacterium]